jgi:hypothetical protein
VTGIVTDQTGAVVAGAKITLVDPAVGTEHTATSGATGLYDFPGLNPGTYSLKVVAKGFEGFAENGITVNVSQTFRHDVKLTVGADTQTVTVEADALAVQTDSNVVSTLISSEQISEIATENRNFAALAALGLGVSSALPDSNTPTSVAASFTISVNGLRQSHNIWLIDGGEADDRGGAGGMDIMPSQDSIAEFNMLTSNYPPDYGISSGATMSLSLKSGTQKYHGEVWEFNRNTDYDANQYFNKQTTPITPRSSTHYNIFGANAGGPLFIPKVYNTNRQHTFFFFNQEWRKIVTGAGSSNNPVLDPADIPTAGSSLNYIAPAFVGKGGSNPPLGINLVAPKNVADPAYVKKLAGLDLTPGECFSRSADANGNCLGNQTIPASLFDPNAVIYLHTGIVPKPNAANDHNITNVSNPIDVWDTVLRVDHKWNDKWQILGHYMHDRVTQGYAQPELGWLWASYNTITSVLSNPSSSAALKLSGTITPNLLVESSINYDGNIINITNSALANIPSGWTLQPFFNTGNPYVTGISGGWNAPYYVAEDTGSAPWHNAAEDYEPKVDVSYTSGKHAMKYGFSYNRYTKNQQLFGDAQGATGFGSQTNDSFMDMLLGITSGYSQFQGTPIRHYVNQTPSAYILDNWHFTPRLTLQLGFRYDALPHAWERANQVSNFDPALYAPGSAPTWNSDGSMSIRGPGFTYTNDAWFYLNGMGLAGQAGFPRGLVANNYNSWQPRFGFSDDLFGNGKTVLRGGFGTFFERLQGNDIYDAATNPPFANNPSNSTSYFSTPLKSWSTGLTAALPVFPVGLTNLAQHYAPPGVAQFSLGIQHELKPSMIWVVQYVGNIAWHQNVDRNINTFPLSEDMAVRCDDGDSGANFSPSGGKSKDVCPHTTLTGVGTLGPNTPPPFGKSYTDQPQSLPNVNLYRTYQGFGGINQEENTTNGTYNGFQTGLRLQNKWGLSGELDYTYSHEIDLTSYDLQTVSNPWNLKYDKGSGDLDRRNIVNANYIYKLPFFTKSTGLVKSIAGGWEIAGTFVDETGLVSAGNNQGPGLSINYDSIGLGGGYTNRPNLDARVTYPKKLGQWFNTGQFSKPIPAWYGSPNLGFGNAAKDAVVGPGRVNFTTSLYKSFAMTERAHFELRFESFNTFNHGEWNNINDSLGASQFGQITTAWDSRVLELGGKFVF